jgi:hypothetical protein
MNPSFTCLKQLCSGEGRHVQNTLCRNHMMMPNNSLHHRQMLHPFEILYCHRMT